MFQMPIKEVSELIEKGLVELQKAQTEKYDIDRADKTASLFLIIQVKMANLLEDLELKAKHSKNMITSIEADVYYKIKSENTSGKITEGALTSLIAKDEKVREAKEQAAKDEANLKKYNYLSNTIKDGHHYFKSLAKKGQWE
jgi:hypothetical protein